MNLPWLSKAAGQPVPSTPTERDMFLSRFYDLDADAPVERMRAQMGRGARKALRELRAEGLIATPTAGPDRDMIVLTQSGVQAARRAAMRVTALNESRRKFEADLRASFAKPDQESAPELS